MTGAVVRGVCLSMADAVSSVDCITPRIVAITFSDIEAFVKAMQENETKDPNGDKMEH